MTEPSNHEQLEAYARAHQDPDKQWTGIDFSGCEERAVKAMRQQLQALGIDPDQLPEGLPDAIVQTFPDEHVLVYHKGVSPHAGLKGRQQAELYAKMGELLRDGQLRFPKLSDLAGFTLHGTMTGRFDPQEKNQP